MATIKNPKFSSILAQKIPNKVARALIYAFLEWTLICLLLFHSVFYLLVTKFARYFGLKPPCFLCSNLFSSSSSSCFYSDIVCEDHASEISKLGYCSNHRKLVEFSRFCSDCSVSHGVLDDGSDVKMCCCCGKLDVLVGPGSNLVHGYVKLGSEDHESDKDRNFDVGKNEVLVGPDSNPEPEYVKLGSDRNFDVGFNGRNEVLVGPGSNPESGYVKLCSEDHESDKDRSFDVGFIEKNEVLVGPGSNPELGYVKLSCEIHGGDKDRSFDVGFNGENEALIENGDDRDVKLGSEDQENDRDRNFDVGFVREDEPLIRKDVLLVPGSNPELGYVKLGSEDQESEKDSNYDVGLNGEGETLSKNGDKKEISDGNKDNLLPQHLEFYIDHDDYRLIPVDLVKVEKREVLSEDFELVLEGDELVPCGFDSKSKKHLPCIKEENEDDEEKEEGVDKVDECVFGFSPSVEEVKVVENGENEVKIGEPECKGEGHDEKMDVEAKDLDEKEEEIGDMEPKEVKIGELTREDGVDDAKVDVEAKDLEENEEEIGVMTPNEVDSSAPLEHTEDKTATHLKSENVEEMMQNQVEEPSTPCKHETHVTTIDNVVSEVSTSANEHDGKPETRDSEGTEPEVAESTPDVDMNSNHTNEIKEGSEAVISESNLHVDVNLSRTINEVEEERIPDTPTSVESLHHLHKKLLLLGRRESATEESLDGGSMISEHEGGDGPTVVEKLKTELMSERKAFRELYKELEEERNAAAIAANQTMAMITRLQEEKATMQMEALQYQRMMEEQSEYDQEALQMMNELMVKREKEKQELEKELDVYRRKVIEYEERERIRVLSSRKGSSMRSRNSSASCSYGEESDGLSIDLNHEGKEHEEDTPVSHSNGENGHRDTPVDAVLNLNDSFEEERQVILEQLKVLEEKLFSLAEEEEEHIENMKPFEQFCEENSEHFDGRSENGFCHSNMKHRINGSMQKRLLPLFDETELLESSDLNEKDGYNSMEYQRNTITKYELEKKRVAIEEEVDNVYERLQALEADREFLKHCIGSLRKGDKGLDLLQEILQHLRDLKSVELQVMKNMDHCASV